MNTIRVAFFLAWRQILRSNVRSIISIIVVMVFTFINLVAVSGILVGLIEGAGVAFKSKFIGDLLVSPLENKKNIPDSENIVGILKTLPEVEAFSERYITQGSIESNYNNRDAGKRRELATGNIYGIIPNIEKQVTHWDRDIVEGEYLNDDDTGKIMLGKNMVGKFTIAPQDKERALGELSIGDRVLVNINGNVNEFIVKGILGGKTDVTRQAFMTSGDLKKFFPNDSSRPTQISIRLKNPGDTLFIQSVLKNNGFGDNQKIQTYEEAQPSFVKDMKTLFSMLGNGISSLGLVVASITIFIVIYINALTRRKYIGIMKGIGIAPSVIELSYVLQSIFYGVTGSLIGMLVVYVLLVPLFSNYPINFPFSDGILVAPIDSTLIKFLVLMFCTILAGYFPARSIVKQNTLNAILGR